MQRVWRVSSLGRFGGVVPIVSGAALCYLVAPPLAAVFGVLGLVGWVLTALRPYVALTDADLVVRNPLRARRISIGHVSRVAPGYGGLTVTTTGGTQIVAWAVQKSNLAQWTGRHTRADDVAEAINKAVESARAPA
jgi:hypothetical protein